MLLEESSKKLVVTKRDLGFRFSKFKHNQSKSFYGTNFMCGSVEKKANTN